MIRPFLERVVSGERLSRDDARALILAVMGGDASDLEIAALLAALRTRGETVDEVVGAALAMRELAVELPEAPPGAIDTCGTGGDGSDSFNISTVSALVAAGAGVPVAKHGNRAASSQCGSAELLEALGVDIEAAPAHMARCVAEVGIGFLYARSCHAAMARVAPIRSALGIRTLFNRLGPLTNPMRPRRQLVGVARAELVEPTLEALIGLGLERVWVVCSDDGMDELSPCADNRVFTWDGRERGELRVAAGSIVPRTPSDSLRGGDAERNAEIARAILDGESGPPRDAILLNAGAALVVAGKAADLEAGAVAAAASIDSGAARDVLERFAKFTQGAAAP